MNKSDLSANEAMILQQVYEDGEDDVRSLSLELGITPQSVIRESMKLEQKGLLDFHQGFDGLLIEVSTRGRAIVRSMWPEAATFAAV